MPFFVVERAADSTLGIPLPDAFPTREAAIAALSAATASGELSISGEIFIADLGSAVPVLVMAPAAVASAEAALEAEDVLVESEIEREAVLVVGGEPVKAEVELVSEEPVDTVLRLVEDVPEEREAEPASEDESEDSLAEAIKRATLSLEDEGIIAPESIEPETPGMATDVAEPASLRMMESPTEAEDTAEEAEESAEEPQADEPEGDEKPEVEEAATSWPWANIEAYESGEAEETAEEESAEDESGELQEVPEQPPFPVEADVKVELYDLSPGADGEMRIITSAPAEGEEAYLPKPVILGDYGADTGEGEPQAPSPIADIEIDAEDIEIEEPHLAEPEPLDAAIKGVEGDMEPEEDPLAAALAAVAEAGADDGYAATGELNLAEYTCQDCIYSNTCPKVGEASPADCGSFQWRSE